MKESLGLLALFVLLALSNTGCAFKSMSISSTSFEAPKVDKPVRKGPEATVSLAWDASPSTNVTSYRLYWGPATATYTNSLDCPADIRTNTVGPLIRGGTYYFAVTALAGTLESLPSNEVQYNPPLPPAPPTNLVIITAQAAPSPAGPWTNVSTFTMTNLEAAGFYRLSITKTNL